MLSSLRGCISSASGCLLGLSSLIGWLSILPYLGDIFLVCQYLFYSSFWCILEVGCRERNQEERCPELKFNLGQRQGGCSVFFHLHRRAFLSFLGMTYLSKIRWSASKLFSSLPFKLTGKLVVFIKAIENQTEFLST